MTNNQLDPVCPTIHVPDTKEVYVETTHAYTGSLNADKTTTTDETPDWCYPLDPLTAKEAVEIGVGSIHHARSCIRIALASLPSGDSRSEVARRLKRCLDHLDSSLDAIG